MIRVISEQEAAEFAKCSFRTLDKLSIDTKVLDGIGRTLKWLMLSVFKGVYPSRAQVYRELESRGEITRSNIRFGRRLMELVERYKIVHPVQPYDLHYGRNVFHGEYATVAHRNSPQYPLIVRLRLKDRNPRHLKGPDIVSLCRWLHFRTSETSLPLVRILNWPMDHDEFWTEYFDEPASRKQLDSLSQAFHQNYRYPNSGPYCKDCVNPDCFQSTARFVKWTK